METIKELCEQIQKRIDSCKFSITMNEQAGWDTSRNTNELNELTLALNALRELIEEYYIKDPIKDYVDFCKDFAIEALWSLKGQQKWVNSISRDEILEVIGWMGQPPYFYNAQKYIVKWWEYAGYYMVFEANRDNGIRTNPFCNADDFFDSMVFRGIQSILAQCPILQCDDYNPQTLKDIIIDQIISEIKEVKDINFNV